MYLTREQETKHRSKVGYLLNSAARIPPPHPRQQLEDRYREFCCQAIICFNDRVSMLEQSMTWNDSSSSCSSSDTRSVASKRSALRDSWFRKHVGPQPSSKMIPRLTWKQMMYSERPSIIGGLRCSRMFEDPCLCPHQRHPRDRATRANSRTCHIRGTGDSSVKSHVSTLLFKKEANGTALAASGCSY